MNAKGRADPEGPGTRSLGSRGVVISVNISAAKGTAKSPVQRGVLREGHGLEGDAHAGPGDRQVSLLAWESVERQTELLREKGLDCPKSHGRVVRAELSGGPTSGDTHVGLRPGDYAENLTCRGLELSIARPGDMLVLGSGAAMEVTRIGKECHRHCAVYRRLGDCVMPREGVFARVVRGGEVAPGDEIRLAPHRSP